MKTLLQIILFNVLFAIPLSSLATPSDRGITLSSSDLDKWQIMIRNDYEYDSFDDVTTMKDFMVWLQPKERKNKDFSIELTCSKYFSHLNIYSSDQFFFSIMNGATIDFKNDKNKRVSMSINKTMNKEYRYSVTVPDETKNNLINIFSNSSIGYFRYHGKSGKHVDQINLEGFSEAYNIFTKKCEDLNKVVPKKTLGKIDGICPNGCDKYF